VGGRAEKEKTGQASVIVYYVEFEFFSEYLAELTLLFGPSE
jgi:hypothetical protein